MSHDASFEHPYRLADVPADVLQTWWEDTALSDPDASEILEALYPIVELTL